MSVEAGTSWTYDKYKFFGLSLSGIRTSIAMPELSLSFDCSQGYPFLLNLKKFFLSHGHLDHAAGVPYIISQKAMTSQPPAIFYMPPSLIDPLDKIMKLWQEIEKHEYDYSFVAVKSGEPLELNPQLFVKAFQTFHRIESFGYTLFEKSHKLKAEFHNATQAEIIELKKQKIQIQDHRELPVVSFTGDTQSEFLDVEPWIKKSKILFLETTYLDERKTTQDARNWGHTHLDEIIARLDDLECEKIVLIHISSRYSDTEIAKILREKIPVRHQDRILAFPGR